MKNFDAIVLAGGRGSRLGGVDKGAIEIDGETLLDRTLRAVSGADRIIVVGEVERSGIVSVVEQPRFAGPAAGIGAALAEVCAAHVLLVGCDHPFLAEGIDLLLAADGADGVIGLDGSGRRQHLMCVLRADALRDSASSQPTLTNLSVRALLAPLDLAEVSVPARAAWDIDTWQDQSRAHAAVHSKKDWTDG